MLDVEVIKKAQDILEDVLDSFPNEMIAADEIILTAFPSFETAKILYCRLLVLFNKYPYMELPGDDEVLYKLRTMVI